jgi:hypothetical protein
VRLPFAAVASVGCMALAAAVRRDGLMATTVTEGEQNGSRMPSASLTRWRNLLAIADGNLKRTSPCPASAPDLAHVIGDQAKQAYRRSDALDKRRKMMEALGRVLRGKSLERGCANQEKDIVLASAVTIAGDNNGL